MPAPANTMKAKLAAEASGLAPIVRPRGDSLQCMGRGALGVQGVQGVQGG